MATVVYRYALRKVGGGGDYRVAGGCRCGYCADGAVRCQGRERGRYELPPEVREQLEVVWAFRQDLVSIEHAREDALKALWSSVPAVAAVEAEIEEADSRAQALAEAVRESRSQRRTIAADPAAARELRDARAAVKELRERRRTLIREHSPALKARLAAIDQERKDAITACRQEHAARGLYSGSYNAALSDHAVAVRQVEKRRARGLPARLRHSRHDGTGTIAVQLKRESGGVSTEERLRIVELAAAGLRAGTIAAMLTDEGFGRRSPRTVSLIMKAIASGRPTPRSRPADPPRSPELLASGEGKWRNVLQLRPWMPPAEFDALPRGQRRDLSRTGEALLAVGGGQTVKLPVAVHRMIPADGELVGASLTVTRLAGQWDAAVNVTVRVPDPPARDAAGSPAVALHLGWRKRADGSVRVATWAADGPLAPPPPELDGIAVPSGDGRGGEIVVPAAWMDRAGYPPGVRGIRDQLLDPARDKLASWLDDHPQDGLAAADVRRWRSPARLAAVALAWRDAPPEGGQEIAALLEEWRVRDRHLWEIECFSADTEILTRDGWRDVAKIRMQDKLATVRLSSDAIEYQRPERLVAKPHAGPMIQVGGATRQGVDLLVTPGHRMILEGETGSRVKLARDLQSHDNVKIRAGTWRGSGVRYVTLPGSRYYPEVSVDAVLLARFLGWYVSEGYQSRHRQRDTSGRHSRVVICQTRAAGREAIREVLDALPWRYRVDRRGFVLNNEQACGLVAPLGAGAGAKRVPQWIKDADADVIRSFVEAAEAAEAGDGSTWSGHESYASISPGLADDMQELYLKLGLGTSLTRKEPGECAVAGHPVYQAGPVYIVHRHTRRWASLRNPGGEPNFREVPYDGMVYCATVPNGTLIVRRNGKVAVCGNCHDRDQLSRHRDEAWRRVGAWLASAAGMIVTDDADLAPLRRRPDEVDDPVLPGAAQKKARARAALSAPGRLRQLVTAAAARRGIPVREVHSAFLSRTCPSCGHVSEAGPQFAAAAVVTCGRCGRRHDQDAAAVRLMLARAAE